MNLNAQCHFDHLFQLVWSKSCRETLLICCVRDRVFNIRLSLNHDPLTRVRVLFFIRSFFFFFFLFLRYDYNETNLTIIQWYSFAKNKKKRNPTFETKCTFFFPTTKMKSCRTLNIFLYPPVWKTFNRLKSLDLYLLSIGEIDLKKILRFIYIYNPSI